MPCLSLSRPSSDHRADQAGVPLSIAPASAQIDSHLFRVLLFRRLHLRLHHFQCAADVAVHSTPFGHHRAACARMEGLGRRAFAVESAGARICREAGGRVAVKRDGLGTWTLQHQTPGDARRLEIVVDGLPLFGGAQFAVDTTLVSELHCDGLATAGRGTMMGAALVSRLEDARRGPILNWVGRRASVGRAAVRSPGGGQRRHAPSSACWHEHAPGTRPHDETASRTSLEDEVVGNPLLCGCSSVCRVIAGIALQSRCRWSESVN